MGISRDKLHKRRATGGRRKLLRGKRKYELGRAPALTKLGEKRIHLVRTRGGHYKHRALRLNEGHFVWPGEAATKRSRILNVVYNATSNELVRTNTLVKGAIVQIDATPFRQWYEQFYRVQIGKKKEAELKEEEAKKGGKKPEPKKEEKKQAEKKEPNKQAEKKSEKKSEKKKEAKKEEKKSEKKPTAQKEEKKESGKKDDKKDVKKTGNTKADLKAAEKARKQRRLKAMEIKKALDSGVRKPSSSLRRKINLRNKNRLLEQALKEQFNTGRILARISSRPGQSGRADGYILEGDELAFYMRKIEKKKKE